MKKNKIKLYQFYNMEKSDYGKLFALCETHREKQKIPSNCVLKEIGISTTMSCVVCDEEKQDQITIHST